MKCYVKDCTKNATETIWVQVGDRYNAFEPNVEQVYICDMHYDERMERVYASMFRECKIGQK